MTIETSIPPNGNDSIPDVPEIDHVDVDPVPDELLDGQWVNWRYEWRRNNKGEWKLTKVPRTPQGTPASHSAPNTWKPWEQVYDHAIDHAGALGVGRVLSPDDPYFMVDLDGCYDQEWNLTEPWAQPWVEFAEAYGLYVEISPSGTGLKIIGRGTLPGSGRRTKIEDGEIELYDRLRFTTITGDSLTTVKAVGDGQDLINKLLTDVFPPERETPDVADWEPTGLTDADVVERASNDKTGEKFRKVWDGDLSEFLNDESAADWHVAGKLNFYTGDREQTERIMRRNGNLYRPKWDSMRGSITYLQQTIMDNVPENFFDPHSDLRMITGQTRKPRKGLLAGAVPLGEMMKHGTSPRRS